MSYPGGSPSIVFLLVLVILSPTFDLIQEEEKVKLEQQDKKLQPWILGGI